MSLQSLSLGKPAVILIVAGVAIVLMITGFQTRGIIFEPNVTEESQVTIKYEKQDTCTVQAEEDVPRTISDCSYDLGGIISITYKQQQPPILNTLLSENSVRLTIS